MAEKAEKIKVTVINARGDKEVPVGIPSNWTVGRFTQEFVGRLREPTTDSGGRPISYTAVLKDTDTPLDSQSTIEKAGVKNGSVIRLRSTQIGGNIFL